MHYVMEFISFFTFSLTSHQPIAETFKQLPPDTKNRIVALYLESRGTAESEDELNRVSFSEFKERVRLCMQLATINKAIYALYPFAKILELCQSLLDSDTANEKFSLLSKLLIYNIKLMPLNHAKALIQKGANINSDYCLEDRGSYEPLVGTVLHEAACKKDTACVRKLLELGANTKANDTDGTSAQDYISRYIGNSLADIVIEQ